MEFRDKLKKLREEKGLSQQDLAEQIFVSRSAVAKWESGNGIPDKVNLETLCALFGVSADELLSKEDRDAFRARTLNRRFSVGGIIFSLLCLVVLLLPMTDHPPKGGPIDAICYYTIPAFFMLNIWGFFIAFLFISTLVYFIRAVVYPEVAVGTKKSRKAWLLLSICSAVSMVVFFLVILMREMDYLWIICGLLVIVFFAIVPVQFLLTAFRGAKALRVKIILLALVAVLFIVALSLILTAAGSSQYDWFFIPQTR